MHSSPASGIKNNRFLPPTPRSTGSTTALPAPAGGRSELFRAYSTLKNCLLLRQTSARVCDKRKCSEEVSCQSTHNEERGLVEPTAFIQTQPPWAGGFEHGPWNQTRGSNPSSATRWFHGQVFQLVLLSREKTVYLWINLLPD